MHKRWPWLVGVLIVLVIVGVITGVVVWRNRSDAFKLVRGQVSFRIFAPSDSFAVDAKDVSYDAKSKVLFFAAVNKGSNQKLSFTEQATPDNFVDVPEVYSKLTEKLQEYKTLDTATGRVSLTHPTELKGQQTAVVMSQGTLIFVRPSKDLSEDDWRLLFNNLIIVK